MTIRAVIFDCFGVLYRDNLAMLYDAVPSDKHRDLQDIMHATDHGFLTRSEYYERVAEIANTTPDAIQQLDDRQHVRDEAMIEFARSLKSSYKVGLLSNIDHGTMERLFPEPQRSELFDAFVLSGDVGIVKPTIEIFEIAARELGIPAEECLMIDDLEKNVEGARAAGMQAIQFISQRQLERDVPLLLDGAV